MMIRHIRFRPRLQSYKYSLSATFFWDVTQRIVVVFTDVSGQAVGPFLKFQGYRLLTRKSETYAVYFLV